MGVGICVQKRKLMQNKTCDVIALTYIPVFEGVCICLYVFR